MNLKNAKFRTKLLLSFSTVAIFVIIVGVMGFQGASSLGNRLHSIGRVDMPAVEHLLAAKVEVEKLKTSLRALLNPRLSFEERAKQLEQVAESRKIYNQHMVAYEKLILNKEKRLEWEGFLRSLEEWKQENLLLTQYSRELEQIGILNPEEMLRKLEKFRGDQYASLTRIISFIETGKSFEGEDGETERAYGRWLLSAQTSNPVVDAAIRESKESHDQFHVAIRKIKELVPKGDKEGARKIFLQQVLPAGEAVIASFDRITAEVDRASSLYQKMEHQTMVAANEKEQAAMEKLDKLIAYEGQHADRAVAEAMTATKSTKGFTVGGLIIGTALALVFSFFLGSSLNKKVKVISEKISLGADQTSSASDQVSSASQNLAEGANEQAASLEETSSSLEEMSSMTQLNSENAQTAKDLAEQTRQAADASAVDMQSMSAAMDEIKQSSDDISKIIKTIDEIAFQTNILALNAAVEAARAGEAGMGFAVVADEVRALAQRSAQAAKETAEKIQEAVNKSKQGVQISSKVGQSLHEMVGRARKVDELVAEIATASKEQSLGINQINTAVSQMDKVTQSNAASSEETAAAAQQLNAQAHEMKAAVRELIQMVEGSNGTTGGLEAERKIPLSVPQRTQHFQASAAPPAPQPAPAIEQGAPPLQKIHIRPRPESVIPLEGDFKDF